MRSLSILLALAVLVCTSGWIVAQSGGSELRRPLDLPSGGTGGDEDEEDAPETITFYGGEYEGDGFFWCLDKSCSMGWNGEIDELKQEFTLSVNSLSSQAEFSAVAFSSGHVVWNPQPQRASPASKAAAITWVQALGANGWTCLGPAAVNTLQIANLCGKHNKRVMILSDGEPYCNGSNTASQVLADVAGANWQQLPVDTIYIATEYS